MTMVAEGVQTAEAAARLAARKGVSMPIVEQVHRVLYDGASPREAVAELNAASAAPRRGRMIDVHSHVLPGIDDGTKELEEAIQFCRLAAERGTEILVATPHHKPGSYQNPRDRVLENVENLRSAWMRRASGSGSLPDARSSSTRGSRSGSAPRAAHLRRQGPVHPARVLVPAVSRCGPRTSSSASSSAA
jgi:hypothetical protein